MTNQVHASSHFRICDEPFFFGVEFTLFRFPFLFQAFALMGAVMGASGVLGPLIGGLFIYPADKYGDVFSQNSFFGQSYKSYIQYM